MSVESFENPTERYNKSSILALRKRTLTSCPQKNNNYRSMPKSRMGVQYGFYPELSPGKSGRNNKHKKQVSRQLRSEMVIEITSN